MSCASAAGETCPAYLGEAIRAHWGVEDPARATGTDSEIDAAFITLMEHGGPADGPAAIELAEGLKQTVDWFLNQELIMNYEPSAIN